MSPEKKCQSAVDHMAVLSSFPPLSPLLFALALGARMWPESVMQYLKRPIQMRGCFEHTKRSTWIKPPTYLSFRRSLGHIWIYTETRVTAPPKTKVAPIPFEWQEKSIERSKKNQAEFSLSTLAGITLWIYLNYTLTTTPPVYYLRNSSLVSFYANWNNNSLSAAGIPGLVAWLKVKATVFCSQGFEEFLVVDWAALSLVICDGIGGSWGGASMGNGGWDGAIVGSSACLATMLGPITCDNIGGCVGTVFGWTNNLLMGWE